MSNERFLNECFQADQVIYIASVVGNWQWGCWFHTVQGFAAETIYQWNESIFWWIWIVFSKFSDNYGCPSINQGIWHLSMYFSGCRFRNWIFKLCKEQSFIIVFGMVWFEAYAFRHCVWCLRISWLPFLLEEFLFFYVSPCKSAIFILQVTFVKFWGRGFREGFFGWKFFLYFRLYFREGIQFI